MDPRFEHIDDVIARFLAGEAGADDLRLLEAWKASDPANAREFAQLERIFSESASLREVLPVNTDKAWGEVHARLGGGKVIPLRPNFFASPALRVAAMVLLVLGLGLLIRFLVAPESGPETILAAADSSITRALPDGSTISLNRGSTLTYASASYAKQRRVKLKGEAFFEVRHDAEHPFIVEAGGREIRDVGTAFNIQAREDNRLVVITVTEGEVSVSIPKHGDEALRPGQELVYDTEAGSVERRENNDPNIAAYKDKIFIFEDASLGVVIHTLQDVYSVRMYLENERLGDCRITATFNDEPIEEITQIIAETLGLEASRTDSGYVFNGNACY